MKGLSINDLFVPTTPLASVFFGVIFLIIIGLLIWLETKDKKTTLLTLLFGFCVVGIAVGILAMIGHYG